MHSATRRERQEIVKSRRAIMADNGLQSSSDPIALHDSAFMPDIDDVGRGSAGGTSIPDGLNMGYATRRKEGKSVLRIHDACLQPYSPPGFFTDANTLNRVSYGGMERGPGFIRKREEPAPIPRLSSQIREELELVRDTSLELSFADEESNTATQSSNGSDGETIKTFSRQPQPQLDHDDKASSFDQLQLQHPFSDKSWRNSGFELETVPGLTDKDSSEDLSDGGSAAGVGYRVTQSWKPAVKKSLNSASSHGGKNGDVMGESDLDESDSSIDSFSLEFPRSAPENFVSSTRIFASPIDSLSDYGVTRHALPGRSKPNNALQTLPAPTQAQMSSSIQSSSKEGESTPLTQYAVPQTAQESFGPSFTLRRDDTDTVRIAKVFPRGRKTSDEKGSSRIASNSTPLTAFQATQHTASSRQSSTLRPSMMLPNTKTAGSQMISSRIAGSSTPLTAFQVTENQITSRRLPIHQTQTSTPLSNYAADSNTIPTGEAVKAIRTERLVGRQSSGRDGARRPDSGHLADVEDLSIEYGRDQQSSLKSPRMTSFRKSTSQGDGTPEALPTSSSSSGNVAHEALPLMAGRDPHQDWASLHQLQDNPVIPLTRKRAREPAQTIRERKQKAKCIAQTTNEQAVSLLAASPSYLRLTLSV